MKRIRKDVARRMYNQGVTIRLVPCKVDPENLFGWYCNIDKSCGENFNKLVNAFEYYNCGYNETGKYAAYYIEEV